MTKQKIKVQGDEVIGKDPRGGQYIVLPFVHPDKSLGSLIVLNMKKEEWKPNIKSIVIEYNETSTK